MSIAIEAGSGAKARVHLDGAHVTSWVPAGSNDEMLFVSAKSAFGPGVSIRGGVPICFPQFGSMGALPQHGFARVVPWTMIESSNDDNVAYALLRLVESDTTRALWPHGFAAEMRVEVTANQLEMTLTITNTDNSPFSFTCALHPYFRTEDAYSCSVSGLGGSICRDGLSGAVDYAVVADKLSIDGALDRIYFDVQGDVVISTPQHRLRIEREGFPDVVVWNPGKEGVDRREDFYEGDERRMLCVEAAAIKSPVSLSPGASWSGVQRIKSE